MKAMTMTSGQGLTRKLFYEDAYQTEFEAVVTDARVSEGPKHSTFLDLYLDQTAFFPEGGGQECDRGILEGFPVEHVFEEKGRIGHRICLKKEQKAEPAEWIGRSVKGEIDWALRFSNMQNHSGEHILSGILCRRFGCENVGFHLGEQLVSLDLSSAISRDDLDEAELEANRIIWRNEPITAIFPDPQTLASLEYRSKLELTEGVRIVLIGEDGAVDRCACCAPHVSRTGEIGSIRIRSIQNYKGGVRLTMQCGQQALQTDHENGKMLDELAALFSTQPQKTLSVVQKNRQQLEALREQCAALLAEYSVLKSEKILSEIAAKGSVPAVICCAEPFSGDDLRAFANVLAHQSPVPALVLGKEERYLLIAPEEKSDSEVLELAQLQKALQQHFGARGGGSSQMISGKLNASIEELKEWAMGLMKE